MTLRRRLATTLAPFEAAAVVHAAARAVWGWLSPDRAVCRFAELTNEDEEK